MNDAKTLKRLSRLFANMAEEEFAQIGAVITRCPKCGEHPVVDRNAHRVFVRCPCGFVQKAELCEI